MSTRSGNSKRSPSSDASSPPGKRLAFEPSEVSKYESKHKYFYFKLDNGKHEWCASKKEADDFLEDFSTIVVDKQSFSLKKDFTKHKAATIKADKEAVKDGLTSPKASTGAAQNEAKLSPQEYSGVERVSRRVKTLIPGNRANGHLKMMRSSRCAVIVWRFLDPTGKEFWTVKPNYIEQTLSSFISDEQFQLSDPIVQEGMCNFMSKRQRDRDGGPDKVKGRTVERNGRQVTYEDHLPVTYILLPDDVMALDMEGRWAFAEEKAQRMGNALCNTFASAPYLLTLKNIVSEGFYLMMTAPKNGPTFQAYMRDCTVVIERMDNSNNLNTHLVLDDAKAVTEMMYFHTYKPEAAGNGDDVSQDDDDSGDEENNVNENDETEQDDDGTEQKD